MPDLSKLFQQRHFHFEARAMGGFNYTGPETAQISFPARSMHEARAAVRHALDYQALTVGQPVPEGWLITKEIECESESE